MGAHVVYRGWASHRFNILTTPGFNWPVLQSTSSGSLEASLLCSWQPSSTQAQDLLLHWAFHNFRFRFRTLPPSPFSTYCSGWNHCNKYNSRIRQMLHVTKMLFGSWPDQVIHRWSLRFPFYRNREALRNEVYIRQLFALSFRGCVKDFLTLLWILRISILIRGHLMSGFVASSFDIFTSFETIFELVLRRIAWEYPWEAAFPISHSPHLHFAYRRWLWAQSFRSFLPKLRKHCSRDRPLEDNWVPECSSFQPPALPLCVLPL